MNDIQKELLKMMADIESAVFESNLDYSVAFGTALGAIRHEGFIPWDDDVDYEVVSYDYKKFISLLKEKLPDKYKVVDEKVKYTDESYTKIINTEIQIDFDYWEYNDNRVSRFLWVDIFELILTNDPKETGRVKKWATLNYLRNFIIRNPLLNYPKKILKLIPPSFIHNRISKNKTLAVQGKKYEYWYTLFLGQAKKPNKLTWEIKTKIVKFETIETRIWSNHDEYLKNKYGNYTKVPKKKDREPHGFWIKKH